MSNPIDLTTLAAVKSWLSASGVAPANTSDDANIAACITTFSAVFIWRTGMGPRDGSVIASSPFVAPVSYNEWYDGSGGPRLFLRNKPIATVSLLTIGPYQIPPSTGWGIAGWVIDGTFSSLSLRGGGGGSSFNSYWWSGYNGTFYEGLQNVNVQYTAGYASIPPDIELIARKAVALAYRRRDWIGQRSNTLSNGAGSTTYTEWEDDPDVARLINNYTRWAVV